MSSLEKDSNAKHLAQDGEEGEEGEGRDLQERFLAGNSNEAADVAAEVADYDADCDSVGKPCCRIPWRGCLALLGGFLIQLTLGSFYSFGNMMTYLTSYMRMHGSPDLTYGDFIIVQSVWGMTQGMAFPLHGLVVKYIGHRCAMFGGCLVFSLGAALTYFTLDAGLPAVAFTYGFVSAFGQGIALIPTMTIGMKWFPKREGMAMGIVVGGFGFGAFVFNQIQTAILNPDNVAIDEKSGYFTDPALLARVPGLMLTLAGIYLSICFVACLMITEPQTCSTPELNSGQNSVTDEDSESARSEEDPTSSSKSSTGKAKKNDSGYIRPKEAVFTREFWILWCTRFCVVLCTQTIAGFYKAFGQTFIFDDHFLSFVGAVCSVFNCSGRLMYGLLMDKTTYRLAMTAETIFLIVLFSTLYASTLAPRWMFAVWVWLIYLTFPGTFSTQPAITTLTFGQKYGGGIYGFLFTSDIVNNLLVGVMSKSILEAWGFLGLFLILAAFGFFALCLTCAFPWRPSPKKIRERIRAKEQTSLDDGQQPKAQELMDITAPTKTDCNKELLRQDGNREVETEA